MPESKDRKQVTTTVPSPEQQVADLRRWLSDNEAFRLLRGKFGFGSSQWFNSGMIDRLAKNHDKVPLTPTSALEEFARINGQAAIILNHMAKLWRDGHHAAYHELMAAMVDDCRVITGEKLPLDQRQAGVLFMYQPNRMLNIIRWVQHVHPQLAHLHLGYSDSDTESMLESGRIKDRPDLRSLTERVVKANPDIRRGIERYHEAEKQRRADRELYLPNMVFPERYAWDWPIEWMKGQYVFHRTRWLTILPPRDDSSYDYIANWHVGGFIPEMTRREFFSNIHRSVQRQMTTWEFLYPASVTHFSEYNSSIGLFPEREFKRFRRTWPTHTSIGTTHGYGAVLMENRTDIPMDDPMFEYKKRRVSDEDPCFETLGMRLSFGR